MPECETLSPLTSRPDQGRVDVDQLALGDLRGEAGLHGPPEEAPKALGTPALAIPVKLEWSGNASCRP